MKKFRLFACIFIFFIGSSVPNYVLVTCSLPAPLASAVSKLNIPFKPAQFGSSGGTANESAATTQDVAGVGAVSLALTYPAGQSPKVFTKGWVFGARYIENKGKSNEKDMSDQVNWSGSGTFQPSTGKLSHPSFSQAGANTITLSVMVGGKNVTQNYPVQAVSPANYAKVGDLADATVAHGCPSDPTDVKGPIANGSPEVTIDGMPAARVGDVGQTCCDCGANSFEIVSGDSSVLIDGKLIQGHGTCEISASEWATAVNVILDQIFSKMSIDVKNDNDYTLTCDQTVPVSLNEQGTQLTGSAKVTMNGRYSVGLGQEEGTFSIYMSLNASSQENKSFPFDLNYSGKFYSDKFDAQAPTFTFNGPQSSHSLMQLIAQAAMGCMGPDAVAPTSDVLCSSYTTEAQFSRPALPQRP